jgi:hypothetical protein
VERGERADIDVREKRGRVTSGEVARDVLRWTYFAGQAKPLLVVMALGSLSWRDRAALRARARRLWSRELERRRVMRSLRVRPTRRESRAALARLAS